MDLDDDGTDPVIKIEEFYSSGCFNEIESDESCTKHIECN